MRTSRFYRPVAGTFAAAVAVGGTLLIGGVSDAAQPAATPVGTVSAAATATGTALTAYPASPVTHGTPVTLTAAVTPATAAGTVRFTDGTTTLGTPVTVTNGTASMITPTLTAGSHQLTTEFTPTNPATFSPSTSSAVSLTVTGSGGDGSLPALAPQAQQSGQSLDELPDLGSGGQPGDPVPDTGVIAAQTNLPDGPLGIPGVMLDAYQRAEQTMAQTQPACRLSWSMLAGIGKIESGHASGGRVDAAGNTLGSIRGARLNGSAGIAAIADTDQGALDGDAVWDRAVGPMQFIPSSWRNYGVQGNGDGVTNPDNIYDSTLAAGRYLCAGGGDLSDPAQQRVAVFRYNHSASYVSNVQLWAQAYVTGVFPTPSAPGSVPPGTNANGDLPTVVTVAQQTAAAAPAVAQLDPPAVAQLDQPTSAVAQLDPPAAAAPPAVAQLDSPSATPPATSNQPPTSLDP